MRCRRICRELLWLARFGEFGPELAAAPRSPRGCRGCRDEVGFDRVMVEQLRIALAARIDGVTRRPARGIGSSPARRIPEPRVGRAALGLVAGMVSRLRFATAMAGTGLALMLALNTQIVPLGLPASDADGQRGEPSALERVPERRPAQSALAALQEHRAAPATVPRAPIPRP